MHVQINNLVDIVMKSAPYVKQTYTKIMKKIEDLQRKRKIDKTQ